MCTCCFILPSPRPYMATSLDGAFTHPVMQHIASNMGQHAAAPLSTRMQAVPNAQPSIALLLSRQQALIELCDAAHLPALHAGSRPGA